MKWLRHFISYFYWQDIHDCAGKCPLFYDKSGRYHSLVHSILWYIYLFKTHREESIKLLNGNPRWLRQASQWKRRSYISCQDEFLRLHMWTLCVAMECRIHETRYQFDVKNISLQHLPNGGGNPAKNLLSTPSALMTCLIWGVQVKNLISNSQTWKSSTKFL